MKIYLIEVLEDPVLFIWSIVVFNIIYYNILLSHSLAQFRL